MSLTSGPYFQVVESEEQLRIVARCPDWWHAFVAHPVGVVMAIAVAATSGFFSVLAVAWMSEDFSRGLFTFLLGGGIMLMGILGLRQLRHQGFEATFEAGKFHYADTRPHQMNLPFYAFDLTPDMIVGVERRARCVAVRLNEVILFEAKGYRVFRFGTFLDPEQLDEFERILREWLERGREPEDTGIESDDGEPL